MIYTTNLLCTLAVELRVYCRCHIDILVMNARSPVKEAREISLDQEVIGMDRIFLLSTENDTLFILRTLNRHLEE